ncbi:hypothetical protein PHYSODRAFT_307155 [Phytophthora sojae]|uniref:HAT C-terminal dimerisation domain-containing protein n=1 Tax=Phytophthora sojae (strain P6497) TaxID=1094619 RepID=G5AD30_PHYSP|nr:hypothetical protein PHYSODRAFT_307155 [Phytophthora sojae]EGZ06084.1 hypothetical protein PHYSODRAFT_307155 [Phytophthora sojae]|eukprot:XP_009537981.1 hypothetical protein PHYSODRAFT_307155 [Phytophthora sojae]
MANVFIFGRRKRFKLGEDTTGLYEDLHCWINDEDNTVRPFGDFTSVHRYWICMRTNMGGGKLPALELAVLSMAINTATCERYLRELALIHTTKRNRVQPEKLRKLALRKRLTDPTERTRLQDRDDRFSHHKTTDNDSDSESVPNPDRALEYWSEVLCELECDDDPPVTPDDNSGHGNAT